MNEVNSTEALSQANGAFAECRIQDANKPNYEKLLSAIPEFQKETGRTVPTEFVEWLQSRVFIGADQPETDSTTHVN